MRNVVTYLPGDERCRDGSFHLLSIPHVHLYRFRKRNYSAAQLNAIENTVRRRSAEVFAYFKDEEEPSGALHAVDILQRLRRS
jgi:hypothetical protein